MNTTTINIIVGINTSPAAEAALRWALSKGDRTGSTVVVVHVYDEAEHADLALEADKEGAVRDSHRRAQMLASTIAGEQYHSGPLQFRARSGDLAAALVEEASAGSVLVVGVPQREQHAEFLDRLAAEAQCAVVAVGEDGTTRVVGIPSASAAAQPAAS